MKYPVRKTTRIPSFDYSRDHYYFVTICTHDKKCLFGSIKEHSCYGKIAADSILEIESHFDGVAVDKFVVMPNHVHIIIRIGCKEGLGQNPNLNNIIGLYKSGVSRRIHAYDPFEQVWQRSFHDHVIRGQKDYEKIWNYIDTNPMRWDKDCFYVE